MQRRTSRASEPGATRHDLELVADTPVTPENREARAAIPFHHFNNYLPR